MIRAYEYDYDWIRKDYGGIGYRSLSVISTALLYVLGELASELSTFLAIQFILQKVLSLHLTLTLRSSAWSQGRAECEYK